MILLEFKMVPMPKPYCDIYKQEKMYLVNYLIEIYGNTFKHGKAFVKKEDVLKFCDENGITIEDLRKVWRGKK